MVLEAQCGELTVKEEFAFYQWRISGEKIRAVEKDGNICYFTDSALCDAKGNGISTSAAVSVDAAKLLDIALKGLEDTSFQCRQEGGIREYTFILQEQGMEHHPL